MYQSIGAILKKQSDIRILDGMTRLIHRERRRKADFLAYLNEVDRRRLYASQGYSSLFRFLTERHYFSESSALKRIQCARLTAKFPFLYREIADGVFSLTSLGRIAPFLKGYNCQKILKACARKSVREVEAFLVKEFPKADVEEMLRRKITPLGEDRVAVQFMADRAFMGNLEKARSFLSHKFPKGGVSEILGLALQNLVDELEAAHSPRNVEKKKQGSVSIPRGMRRVKQEQVRKGNQEESGMQRGRHKPNEQEGFPFSPARLPDSPRTRHIPRGIFREVWSRDSGKCQFKRPDGSICGETRFLEIDHVHPFALGGPHQRENLRLLCWAHNQLRAEARFGPRGRRV